MAGAVGTQDIQIIDVAGQVKDVTGICYFSLSETGKKYLFYHLGETVQEGRTKMYVAEAGDAVGLEQPIEDATWARLKEVMSKILHSEEIVGLTNLPMKGSQIYVGEVKKIGVPDASIAAFSRNNVVVMADTQADVPIIGGTEAKSSVTMIGTPSIPVPHQQIVQTPADVDKAQLISAMELIDMAANNILATTASLKKVIQAMVFDPSLENSVAQTAVTPTMVPTQPPMGIQQPMQATQTSIPMQPSVAPMGQQGYGQPMTMPQAAVPQGMPNYTQQTGIPSVVPTAAEEYVEMPNTVATPPVAQYAESQQSYTAPMGQQGVPTQQADAFSSSPIATGTTVADATVQMVNPGIPADYSVPALDPTLYEQKNDVGTLNGVPSEVTVTQETYNEPTYQSYTDTNTGYQTPAPVSNPSIMDSSNYVPYQQNAEIVNNTYSQDTVVMPTGTIDPSQMIRMEAPDGSQFSPNQLQTNAPTTMGL